MTQEEKLAQVYVKKIRKTCYECGVEESVTYKAKGDMDKVYRKSDLRLARLLRNYERKLLNLKEHQLLDSHKITCS